MKRLRFADHINYKPCNIANKVKEDVHFRLLYYMQMEFITPLFYPHFIIRIDIASIGKGL